MKRAISVGVILLLLLGLGAGCKSSNVLSGLNFAPEIYSATFNPATRVLMVNVHDRDGDALTVSLSLPAGLAADVTQRSIAGGGGLALFTLSAVNPAAGASDTVVVSVTDAKAAAVTRNVTVSIPPGNTAPAFGAITFANGTLTVHVNDTDGDPITVSVTEIVGMAVDKPTQTVPGGTGSAVFEWSPQVVMVGETTISITDGKIPQPVTSIYTISFAGSQPPSIDNVVWNDNGDGSGTLTVTASAELPGLIISVSEVAGTTVDQLEQVFDTASATAVFTYVEVIGGAGATGNAIVSVYSVVQGSRDQSIPIDIASNAAPVINSVNYDEPELTVDVIDADGDDLEVSVTVPAGLLVDATHQTISGGAGVAHFVWDGIDPPAQHSGTTTISVSDGRNALATATQDILIGGINPPPVGPFDADTLYAFSGNNNVGVGDPVTIYIITGAPANPLLFLSSVGFTVETAGAYVANSFNAGMPGGARTDTDGYWGTLGPPAPANGQYLDLGDALMPGPATDIGGGFHRYNFAIVTQGPFAAPAAFTNGVLFSFSLSFSAPGTYHLGFQLNDGSFDQTYYSDQNGTNYFWGTLDSSYTVTVE